MDPSGIGAGHAPRYTTIPQRRKRSSLGQKNADSFGLSGPYG
jgi:hypothetical protein